MGSYQWVVPGACELCHNERHSLAHEARNEMYIARQAIQFGHHNVSPELFGLTKGGGELWTFFEGVGTFARLDLNKLASDLHAFISGKLSDSVALCVKAKAAPALAAGG